MSKRPEDPGHRQKRVMASGRASKSLYPCIEDHKVARMTLLKEGTWHGNALFLVICISVEIWRIWRISQPIQQSPYHFSQSRDPRWWHNKISCQIILFMQTIQH